MANNENLEQKENIETPVVEESKAESKNAFVKGLKKVLVTLGHYFKGVGADMKRAIQDNPSIIFGLLCMVPGIFIGLFLEQHVQATYPMPSEYGYTGLMLFIMELAGCLDIVFGFQVKGQRSLKASIFASICTAVVVVSGIIWVRNLIVCDEVWVSEFKSQAVVSMICVIISAVAPLVGAVGSFFTIKWDQPSKEKR